MFSVQTALQSTLLSNALLVVPLALLVVLTTRFVRRPAIVWALWGVVLLKFVTPAVVSLPVQSSRLAPRDEAPQSAATSVPQTPSLAAPQHDSPSQHAVSLTDAAFADAGVDDIVMNVPPDWSGAHHAEREGYIPERTMELAPAVPLAPPSTQTPLEVPPLVDAEPLPDVEPTVASEPAPPDFEATQPRPATTPLPDPQTSVASASTTYQPSIDWQHALWLVWIVGSLLAATLAIWRTVRFRRLLRQAAPADAATLAIARRLADDLGLRRLPDIRTTAGRVPPLLFAGLFRTTVLLPQELLAALDDESRRTLLAHELVHVARRDHLTRWLELAVRALYWWHPVAWWAGRRLREAEEHCCDARVVRLLPDSAHAYAHTILTTVDYLSTVTRPIPALATGLQPVRRSVRPLHRRLQMIVETPTTSRTPWLLRLLVLTLAACVLPVALTAGSEENVSESPATETVSELPEIQGHVAEPIPLTSGGTDSTETPNEFLDREVNDPMVVGATTSTEEAGDFEEFVVVVRQHKILTGAYNEYVAFLRSLRLALPIFTRQQNPNSIGRWPEYAELEVLSSEEFQNALDEFIRGTQNAPAPNPEAEQLTLARGRYNLNDVDTAEAFAGLLERYGLFRKIDPLIAEHNGNTVTVTALRPLHETISTFVDFLSEHKRTVTGVWHDDPNGGVDVTHSQTRMAQPFGNDVSKERLRIQHGQLAASREVLDADLRIAEAEVQAAQEKLETLKRLVSKGNATQEKLRDAELKLLRAKRSLLQIKTQLDEDRSSPFTAPDDTHFSKPAETSQLTRDGAPASLDTIGDSEDYWRLVEKLAALDEAIVQLGPHQLHHMASSDGVPDDPVADNRALSDDADKILTLLNKQQELTREYDGNHPEVKQIATELLLYRANQLRHLSESERRDRAQALKRLPAAHRTIAADELITRTILQSVDDAAPDADRADILASIVEKLKGVREDGGFQSYSSAFYLPVLEAMHDEAVLIAERGPEDAKTKAKRQEVRTMIDEYLKIPPNELRDDHFEFIIEKARRAHAISLDQLEANRREAMRLLNAR